MCWSSSRLQPLQNNNLIKFAIIRPSTLNHDKNLWSCRGSPDETTCSSGFFRCPSALALICMKLFNVCANKLFLSLSPICNKLQYLAYLLLFESILYFSCKRFVLGRSSFNSCCNIRFDSCGIARSKFGGDKMFDFRRATVFGIGRRCSKCKRTRYAKYFIRFPS